MAVPFFQYYQNSLIKNAPGMKANPGSVQGQVGWSSEQPGLVEDVPAHGRGIGTRWSLRSLPTQTIL